MIATMAFPIASENRQSPASVDVRELEEQLIQRTLEINRDLPRGVRPIEVRRLETDFTRRGQPTIARWLRIALAGIHAGLDARLYGEAVADVLGAAVASVLPVPEASLAECLAESHLNPVRFLADQPNATPEQVLDAAIAMRDEAQRAKDAELAYRRKWREMVRARSGL